eukprot:SAG22_NODE_373_length_11549_cov_12.592052_10_plen_207_part_00
MDEGDSPDSGVPARLDEGADSPDSGVPAGFVGRLPRQSEFGSIGEYSAAVVAALEARSREVAASPSPSPVVERVPLAEVGEAEFLERWGRRGLPVVLTGCGRGAGLDLEGRWSPAALAKDYGDCPWSVRRGKTYEETEHAETSLGEYLREAAVQAAARDGAGEGGGGGAGGGYYGANNYVPPGLLPALRLPPFLPPHVKRLLDTRL